MKAKIRGTNIEMEVRPFYDETGYFAGFTNGYNNYHSADIVFSQALRIGIRQIGSPSAERRRRIYCALF